MMGVALGVLHLSFSDFMLLTPAEFGHVWQAYQDREESLMRECREIMRMQATIGIQPHVKNKLTPDKVLPFPWEKPAKPKVEKESLTQDERKARFLSRLKHPST